MEQIKRAVERAKAGTSGERQEPTTVRGSQVVPQQTDMLAAPQRAIHELESLAKQTDSAGRYDSVLLDWPHLEQHRIVAHNVADPRSKAFDVLRTQVLQVMDHKQWTFLGITSPTVGCGKTVTAINLALSVARQRERSVVLVDADLQRPRIATYLGIKRRQGMRALLEGKVTLMEAIIRARTDGCEIAVIPAEAATVHSSELIASRNMSTMLQEIKRTLRPQTVIFDMPPLLQGDEALTMLPKLDAMLLVTAVGTTTVHEIKECNGHLQETHVIRLVLNKSHETTKRYYYAEGRVV